MRKLTQIPPAAGGAEEAGAAAASASSNAGAPSLPEPVFHDARHRIKIYQGDCLDILAAIPAEKVDLIFAEPPYFLSNAPSKPKKGAFQ